jgi:hypothetical protein
VTKECEVIRQRLSASRWAPTTLDDGRVIAVGQWNTERPLAQPARCSIRLQACNDGLTIGFSPCDVMAWSEARPKERHGTLALTLEQAEYLRDALTAMLERKP